MHQYFNGYLADLQAQAYHLPERLLPYTIVQVVDRQMLEECINLRAASYSRFVPAWGEQLRKPEQADMDPGFIILAAISKISGRVIGTVRLEIRDNAPLAIEASFRLPRALRQEPVAEVTRLAISNSHGYSPRLMLIKATSLLCRFKNVRNMFIGARSPVDRQYTRFEMNDLLPNAEKVPLAHAGGVPHRIMWINLQQTYSLWKASGNPLIEPMFLQCHPDILGNLQMRMILSELEQFNPSLLIGEG